MPELKKYDVTYYLSSTVSKAKNPESKIQHNVITVEAGSESEALTLAATPKRIVISAKLRGPGRKKAQELLTQAEIFALLAQQQEGEGPADTQTESESVVAEQETQTDEAGDPDINELADADGAGCDCAYCTSEAAQEMRDTIAEGLQDFVGKPTEEVQAEITERFFSLLRDQDLAQEEQPLEVQELEAPTAEQVKGYLKKIDRTLDTLTRSLNYASTRLEEESIVEGKALDALEDNIDEFEAAADHTDYIATALEVLEKDHAVLPEGIEYVLDNACMAEELSFDQMGDAEGRLDLITENIDWIERREVRLQAEVDALHILRAEIVKLLPIEEPAAKLSFTSLTFSVAWNFLLLLLVAVCVFGMFHTVTDIPGVERLAYVLIIAGVAARFAFQYLSKDGIE